MHKWSKYSLTTENIGLYEEIYENLIIWDCHTHIGVDKDGHTISTAQLVRKMDEAKVDTSIIFPLNHPGENKLFTKPNDIIHRAYKKYPKRFIPFCRLNPNARWKKEFDRCIDLGFKGVKLHPRSQDFKMTSSVKI